MDFWAIAGEYGLPAAMLIYGMLALYFDWVVSGRRYREVCGQRDRLLKLALGGQRKAWQVTELADALVQPREGETHDAGE